MVPMGEADGGGSQIFGGQLGFMGRLRADVLILHFMDFLVYLQIHGTAHAQRGPGLSAAAALRLYLLYDT
ncbi:hypothetical protein, partial [Cloacibacillus evryensis]|uniref:hypothetical protein n=1 Tax=Cloacibacillus evryensis TaxID=508460 RepID=UPI00210E3CA2